MTDTTGRHIQDVGVNEQYPPLTLEERNFLALFGFEVARFNKWGVVVRENGYVIAVFDRQRPIEDWIAWVKGAKQVP